MTSDYWPRYEVFKQDSLKKKHEAVGSVHAPDAELAMLNARNVFVRRPNCVSLWVARESDILYLTAEEMAKQPDWHVEPAAEGDLALFHVFHRKGNRRSMIYATYVSAIEAVSANQALKQVLERVDTDDVYIWWVVPDGAILRSGVDDVASMFAPAKEKTYRQQSAYGFVGLRGRRER